MEGIIIVFTLRKKTDLRQSQLNAQEVYTIWDLHTYGNWSLEQLRIWNNFIHDIDLKILNDSMANTIQSRLTDIGKLIAAYKLDGKSSTRKNIYIPSNSDNIFDEHIASWLLSFAQERLEMKLKILRTAVTNDNLRELVLSYIKGDVDQLNIIIKVLKLRGWIQQGPIFPDIASNSPENIDCGEAYHIWDHLTFRYDNIEFTQEAINMAHDSDFKAILIKGLRVTLKKQAEKLEKEIIKFGLPMPASPPEIISETQTTEYRTDKSIYKQLLQGMEAASILHAQAIKQSTTNDRIRNIFSVLFLEEVNLINNMVKFGKIKGWLNPPPSYRQ